MKHKYRRTHHEPTAELKALLAVEWARAKKILKPLIDGHKKPALFIKLRGTRRRLATHRGGKHVMAQRVDNRWLKVQHVIVFYPMGFNKKRSADELRRTMQHEICHCIEQNHSARFQSLLKQMQDHYAANKI